MLSIYRLAYFNPMQKVLKTQGNKLKTTLKTLLSVCIMVFKQKTLFEQTLPYFIFSFPSFFCADVQ